MTHKLLGRKRIRREDEIIEPGDIFEPTDAELKSFSDKLEAVDSEASDEPSQVNVTVTGDEDTVEDVSAEVVEEAEGESEEPDYESMDYSELRQLAAEADTDEINGKSSKAEMLAYFTGE